MYFDMSYCIGYSNDQTVFRGSISPLNFVESIELASSPNTPFICAAMSKPLLPDDSLSILIKGYKPAASYSCSSNEHLDGVFSSDDFFYFEDFSDLSFDPDVNVFLISIAISLKRDLLESCSDF